MNICENCRCYHPVSGNNNYCGECCIGGTRNPIAVNENITGCCLFEPKPPKSNGDSSVRRDCESCKKFSRNDPYESEGYCGVKRTWVDPQEGEDCKMHEFTLNSATKYKDGTPIMKENKFGVDFCEEDCCPHWEKNCGHTLEDKQMCPYLPHDTDSNLKYLEQTFTEFAKVQDELIEEYDATLKTHGDTLEEHLDRICELENMYENVLEDLCVMKERLCKITSFVTNNDKYAHVFENFCGNCVHASHVAPDEAWVCELSGEVVDPDDSSCSMFEPPF